MNTLKVSVKVSEKSEVSKSNMLSSLNCGQILFNF